LLFVRFVFSFFIVFVVFVVLGQRPAAAWAQPQLPQTRQWRTTAFTIAPVRSVGTQIKNVILNNFQF
jgi:hypothetical protein